MPSRGDDGATTVVNGLRPQAASRLQPGTGRYLQVEVIGGPMDGERRRVRKSVFTIGRGETNDLPLPFDPTVSLRHAQIVRKGGRFWLQDVGSSNGTYIGEERIGDRAPVGVGTQFVLGTTRLEFTAA